MLANRDQEVGAAGTAICDRHHTPVESFNPLAGPLWIIERERHYSVWRRAAQTAKPSARFGAEANGFAFVP
jgi:hypothetical protein